MSSEKAIQSNTRVLPDGKIEVSPRAIATIAARAVGQCYGVVGMAPQSLREGVAEVLRQEDQHKGIAVHIGIDAIAVDLHIVVAYGTRVGEVARNVQETVRYAVERTVGIPVSRVNIRVQGIRVGNEQR